MLTESLFVKIQVIVPLSHAESVREILGKFGAGVQGNYEYCSGSIRQLGRFRPLPGANPALGIVGKIEEVEEEIIQTICHKDLVETVIAEVKKVHPYEEPAIDIFPRLEIQ